MFDYTSFTTALKVWGAFLLWLRGGSSDNTTRKWVIRNILKENCTCINDSWEKYLLSSIQSWILPFLVTAYRDCAEESLAGICKMRASPSVGETPQQFYTRELYNHRFSGHMSHYIRNEIAKRKIYLSKAVTEKYPLEYVFVNNFVSSNEFSTYGGTDFLSRSASYRRNIKWARKTLTSNYRFNSLEKTSQQQKRCVHRSYTWL